MKRACLIIVSMLLSGAASAQTEPPASEEQTTTASGSEAEKLFNEGVAAAKAGDYATACAKFSRSLELVSRASTLLNLAECEAEQGKLASALERYKTGVALLPPGDERLQSVAGRMEQLSKRVPRLTVALDRKTPGTARVLIDGGERPRGSLELVPLDPGEHEVVLAVPGHRDASYRVQLREGDRKTATLAPGPVLPLEARPVERDDGRPLRLAGFVVGAVGVAGAIGAGVTGGLLLANDATIEENCPNKICNQEGLAAIDESEGLVIGNYVTWGVAIAGLGAGAGLLIADALTNDAGQEAMSVTAAPLPGGGWATLTLSF